MYRWMLAAGMVGVAMFCAASFAYGEASIAAETPQVEAQIDWQQGLATATALFPVPDHQGAPEAAQALALHSAKLAARRKLLEALGGPSGVEPRQELDRSGWDAMRDVYGIMEESQIVSEVIMQDGAARVTVAAWFDRNRAARAQRMGPSVLTNAPAPSIRMLVTRRRLHPNPEQDENGGKEKEVEDGASTKAGHLKPKRETAETGAGAWVIRMAVRRYDVPKK